MASHELRAPIGTLLFAAAVLQIDGVPGSARLAKVTPTSEATPNGSSLVQNLQRLTQLTETVDVASEVIDLGSMATEVARQLKEMADARRRGFALAPTAFGAKRSGPRRARLINLCRTASKQRPVEADLVCRNRERRRRRRRVRRRGARRRARDRRGGADRRLRRFVRAHAHLDSELGVTGAGLGLSIVSECVHALGGTIRLESEAGEGSAFFVSLPTP
jgi:signal transduction histidine kinase